MDAPMNCMTDRNNPIVRCPQCHKLGHWFSGSNGPFCSNRCRLIDLGKWFNEEHAISRELRAGDFEGFDELPPGPDLDQIPTTST
jgi:endogenous inhibitor of DNA gyrase (YacG/DUF329 family)